MKKVIVFIDVVEPRGNVFPGGMTVLHGDAPVWKYCVSFQRAIMEGAAVVAIGHDLNMDGQDPLKRRCLFFELHGLAATPGNDDRLAVRGSGLPRRHRLGQDGEQPGTPQRIFSPPGGIYRLGYQWSAQNRDAWRSVARRDPRAGRPAKKLHATGKPVSVMEQLVQCVPPGGVVFDPFMGSASTAIACIRTGRKFVGVELSSEYYDIAENRIREELAA